MIQFFKYQGTGNDFVIIDNRKKNIQLTEQQIHLLCDRKFGVGADGLMFLQEKNGYDFEMIYYNADGKLGSMCGNGSRCLTKFAYEMGIKKEKYNFIASDGEHESVISKDGWIRVKMQDVNSITQINNNSVLDTGSPHIVINKENFEDLDVYEEGKKIRYSEAYKQKGINVNFVQQVSKNSIIVRTYERGVEDETLSCGTGVTASSLVYNYDYGFNKIEVKTLGGSLAVEYEKAKNNSFSNIWLCGPALLVYSGEIKI